MAGGVSTPTGFRPFRHRNGGTPNRYTEHPIASGYNTDLGVGDPVAALGDGTIVLCGVTARILGIFMGVNYIDAGGNAVFKNYWPADTVATNIQARVITDPGVTYEVESGKSSAPDQTDVNLLADHVAAGVNTVMGDSRTYLSGTQTTGDAQFRILGLVKKPYNTGAQYDTVEVSIWEHELGIKGDEGTPGV
jgi:hypothetical protein